MIHVYAFAERLEDVPPVAGLDGATVERLRVDDVDVVFSRRVEHTSRDTLRRDALAHGAVVEALTEVATAVAPVRFGEVLADEDALGASLRERLPEIHRAFDRVRDCVEVAVRIHDHAQLAAVQPTDGTSYLRNRAAAESRRREATDELQRQLSALAREVRVSRDSAAYLVSTDRIDDVRLAVDGFAASHPDFTVICTGPWAPFSFVQEAA